MPSGIRELKYEVHSKVPKECMEEIIEFVEKSNPRLWGVDRDKNFLKNSVYTAVYKEITGTGYQKLQEKVREWLNISHHSLLNNQHVLREIFYRWGKDQITIGNSSIWDEVAAHIEVPRLIAGCNLLLDSCDFRLQGKASTSTSDDSWSYKENSPAQRFQAITDLMGRIRYLSLGYSPKAHDTTWLKINSQWIKDSLIGGVLLGDNHYEWGKTHFSDPKFFIKFKPTISVWSEKKQKMVKRCTKDQQKYNKAHAQVRAHVEHPFAVMKNLFTSISQPFFESEEQHNFVVTFCAGVHNWKVIQQHPVQEH